MSGCGCKSGMDKRGREWIDECAKHAAESAARHDAMAAERAEARKKLWAAEGGA